MHQKFCATFIFVSFHTQKISCYLIISIDLDLYLMLRNKLFQNIQDNFWGLGIGKDYNMIKLNH